MIHRRLYLKNPKFKNDSKIDKLNVELQVKLHTSATKASKTYNLITCLNSCFQHLKDDKRYRIRIKSIPQYSINIK